MPASPENAPKDVEEDYGNVRSSLDETDTDAPNPGPPPKKQRRPLTRAFPHEQFDLPADFPTFDNYRELTHVWPIGRCKQVMLARKDSIHPRASADALAELQLALKQFLRNVWIISMISNISFATAKKEL